MGVTILSMTMLLGFMALALDVSLLFRAKRNLQTVADAAAGAAALDYYYNVSVQGANAVSHAQTAGQTVATYNTTLNNMTGTTVAINCAPTSGPKASASCNGYFEAIASQPNPTLFMSVFGSMFGNTGLSSITVAARGVAGTPATSTDCIWIMNPKASDALYLSSGGATLTATGCSIYVNSTSPTAFAYKGNPTITVQSLNLHSSETVSTKNHFTGTVNSNVASQSPPLPVDATGPVPANGDCTKTDSVSAISSTYPPSGGVTADEVICFTGAVTLNSGANLQGALGDGVVYVFENGVTVAGGATVNVGSATYDPSTQTFVTGKTYGATIDLQGGAFNMASGQANLSVYAPTSGTYDGIAIMQPYSNKSASNYNGNACTTIPATNPLCGSGNDSCMELQFGSSSTFFDGMIFDPCGQVGLHDNGGGVTASGLIVDSLNIKSSSLTIPNYSAANPQTTPLRMVTLTE